MGILEVIGFIKGLGLTYSKGYRVEGLGICRGYPEIIRVPMTF